MLSPETAWLAQRRYLDLDPRAERALREAGLRFTDGETAEAFLREAAEIAPGHEAVLIAHYRYHLYKHRYEEASFHAAACLARAAAQLGVAADPFSVAPDAIDQDETNAAARAWMFACQADAYVRMRAGREAEGRRLLEHLGRIDSRNQTRTLELLRVLESPSDADDPDDPDEG